MKEATVPNEGQGMKRRDFLRMALGGAAVAAMTPKSLFGMGEEAPKKEPTFRTVETDQIITTTAGLLIKPKSAINLPAGTVLSAEEGSRAAVVPMHSGSTIKAMSTETIKLPEKTRLPLPEGSSEMLEEGDVTLEMGQLAILGVGYDARLTPKMTASLSASEEVTLPPGWMASIPPGRKVEIHKGDQISSPSPLTSSESPGSSLSTDFSGVWTDSESGTRTTISQFPDGTVVGTYDGGLGTIFGRVVGDTLKYFWSYEIYRMTPGGTYKVPQFNWYYGFTQKEEKTRPRMHKAVPVGYGEATLSGNGSMYGRKCILSTDQRSSIIARIKKRMEAKDPEAWKVNIPFDKWRGTFRAERAA
ncbi:MAG: hypothetical protein V1875_00480 [Candidatus Altiarchaeota archaeon]